MNRFGQLLITVFIAIPLLCCCATKRTSSMQENLETYVKSDLSKVFLSDSFKILLPLLDSIMLDDQRYRFGNDGSYLAHKEEQGVLDSINVVRLKRLIQQYGWLSFQQIGIRSAHLLVVLLHLSKKEDWEYFLPITINAYHKKTLASSGFFSFVDRYLMVHHEPQLFGTQIVSLLTSEPTRLYPVYMPLQLEERWGQYGGGVFKYPSYIKGKFHITWDANAHLQTLPETARSLGVRLDSVPEVRRILQLLGG